MGNLALPHSSTQSSSNDASPPPNMNDVDLSFSSATFHKQQQNCGFELPQFYVSNDFIYFISGKILLHILSMFLKILQKELGSLGLKIVLESPRQLGKTNFLLKFSYCSFKFLTLGMLICFIELCFLM